MPRQKQFEEKEEKEPEGLRCPDCNCGHIFVIYTKPAGLGKLRRLRECRACSRRFMTTESM